jgi:hypothetical protein
MEKRPGPIYNLVNLHEALCSSAACMYYSVISIHLFAELLISMEYKERVRNPLLVWLARMYKAQCKWSDRTGRQM